MSADGRHRGKYQFDQSTWEGLGGTGDPAAAPETEQDARAAQLLSERGTAPWPVCGGELRAVARGDAAARRGEERSGRARRA